MADRKYPKDATPDQRRQIDNLSELSAYAFGFSDKKPGWTYWAIQAVIVLVALSKLFEFW